MDFQTFLQEKQSELNELTRTYHSHHSANHRILNEATLIESSLQETQQKIVNILVSILKEYWNTKQALLVAEQQIYELNAKVEELTRKIGEPNEQAS